MPKVPAIAIFGGKGFDGALEVKWHSRAKYATSLVNGLWTRLYDNKHVERLNVSLKGANSAGEISGSSSFPALHTRNNIML